MKRRIILSVGALAAFLWIFTLFLGSSMAEESPKKAPAASACPHESTGPVANSKIKLLEDSHDFGQIPYNRRVTHVFHFENVGTAPLSLASHVTSKAVEGC